MFKYPWVLNSVSIDFLSSGKKFKVFNVMRLCRGYHTCIDFFLKDHRYTHYLFITKLLLTSADLENNRQADSSIRLTFV